MLGRGMLIFLWLYCLRPGGQASNLPNPVQSEKSASHVATNKKALNECSLSNGTVCDMKCI